MMVFLNSFSLYYCPSDIAMGMPLTMLSRQLVLP